MDNKGSVILDSKWLDWRMKVKQIYTQRLMIGFEMCRDCVDCDVKEALNVPAVH